MCTWGWRTRKTRAKGRVMMLHACCSLLREREISPTHGYSKLGKEPGTTDTREPVMGGAVDSSNGRSRSLCTWLIERQTLISNHRLPGQFHSPRRKQLCHGCPSPVPSASSPVSLRFSCRSYRVSERSAACISRCLALNCDLLVIVL